MIISTVRGRCSGKGDALGKEIEILGPYLGGDSLEGKCPVEGYILEGRYPWEAVPLRKEIPWGGEGNTLRKEIPSWEGSWEIPSGGEILLGRR